MSHKSKTRKDAHFHFRVPRDVAAAIRRAARRERVRPSEFLRRAAVARAQTKAA